jgi:DNA ligase 1
MCCEVFCEGQLGPSVNVVGGAMQPACRRTHLSVNMRRRVSHIATLGLYRPTGERLSAAAARDERRLSMLLIDVVRCSLAVASSPSRLVKRDAMSALLSTARREEIAVVVGLLTGEVRQGRFGVGWSTVLSSDVDAAREPSLTVIDVDEAMSQLAAASGSGSVATRRALLDALWARCTADEQKFLTAVLLGELRQGALDAAVTDAVSHASGVGLAAVRRGAMVSGSLAHVAEAALHDGHDAVAAIDLVAGRAILPMLASPGGTVAECVGTDGGTPVVIDWKLDGARVQVHRVDDDVSIFTRNLNDITDRLPGVVDVVRNLAVTSVVLDGEALMVGNDGRPQRFQDTMASFSSQSPGGSDADSDSNIEMRAYFFDALLVDGRSLLDEPLHVRLDELERVAGRLRVPSLVTSSPDAATEFADAALAAGHEGVVIKDPTAPYGAGRRGSAWRKVKPVKSLDLVVLAAEWGHGRRTGWLSNLHLGARGREADEFVMVGKTFKGLTDEMLRWQTEAFLALETRRTSGTVWLQPKLVVEIALDGAQVSSRYPGGVALRFARVKGYRPDKSPADADTIQAVQALLG